MDDFDNLDARLRPNRHGAMKKISERIAAIERLRPALIILGVFGAFLAAFGKVSTARSGS